MTELQHFRDGKVVLYRRAKSPKWQARLKIPNGKWHRMSTKETDLNLAKEIACDKYDDIRFRTKNNLSILTKKFSNVAQQTKKELTDQLLSGYGKVSYTHYIGAIDRYLIPFFGDINVDSIDHKKLQEFDQWRAKKIGRVPKKSTINNHNSALTKIFAVALKHNWIHQFQIPEIKNTGVKSERRPHFTREEYQKLYRFMRTWYKEGRKQQTREIRELLRDYVLILTNTGMRHGTETRNLKWKNIEQFESHNGVQHLRFYVNGKTGKRELVANTAVKRYLRRIQERFDDLKDLSLEELFKVDEPVFRTRSGDIPKDWHGSFEILMKDSGLWLDKHDQRRTLYSLRHTYATFKLLAGLEIHTLAKQMGTSVQMIEQHYSHLIPSLNADRITNYKKN